MPPRTPASSRLIPLPATGLHALVLIIALLGCGSSDPVQEVRDLHAKGQFAESLEPLRTLLESHSDDPEVHYLHGLALSASGQPTLAQWSFRKAMEDDEWRLSAALALASGALQTANHDAAIEAATTVLEIDPDHSDALMIRTHARIGTRRDYEGALEDADRVLELDPENSTALSLRGAALLGLERIDDAKVVVEELERRFREENLGLEDTARYCATRATFAKESADAEEAERLFDECLETFPARQIVVSSAVEFFDGLGRRDRSLEILQAALEEAPYGVYRNAVASRLRAMGDNEAAEAVLKEGTELEVPSAALASWVYLAHFYLDLDRMDEGVAALKRALEAGGDQDPQLGFEYAEALILAGRNEEAEKAAADISLVAYRELIIGRSLLARGRAAEALEHFSAGLLLWPNNAGARYYSGIAAEQAGDFDRAIAEFRYSIRSDPAATDARLRLTRLHRAEGVASLALVSARQGSNRYAPDIEAQILAVEVAAESGNRSDMRGYLRLMSDPPATRAEAVAAAARGLRRRAAPQAAVKFLLEQTNFDLTQPVNAPALRVLVQCAGDVGSAAGGLDSIESALAKHPGVAAFHEIRGMALTQTGASVELRRAAYERALELDPKTMLALIGLGRIAASQGQADEALVYFERAAEAAPEEIEPLREAALLLVSLGRKAEAEAALEKLLVADPYDPQAAIALAELLVDRGAGAERSLELANRAVRFRGGPEAHELLARVHEQSGEHELAAAANERASELRERAANASAPAAPEG